MFKANKNSSRSEFEKESLRYMDTLYRNALGLTRNADEAEDLVQDTYLKAYRFYGSFESGTNLKAWLLKIMFNTFVNRYRRSNRERLAISVLSDDAESFGVLGESTVIGLTNAVGKAMWPIVSEEIESAINKLPEDYQLMVTLADVEQMTYREIADVVGCPIGTVMSRLHRARQALREHLIEHAKNLGIVGNQDSEAPAENSKESKMVLLEEYRRERGNN